MLNAYLRRGRAIMFFVDLTEAPGSMTDRRDEYREKCTVRQAGEGGVVGRRAVSKPLRWTQVAHHASVQPPNHSVTATSTSTITRPIVCDRAFRSLTLTVNTKHMIN